MPPALIALAIGAFGIGTTEFVAMGILPQVARSYDITIPAAGHMISAYALGVVVGAPLLALLSARIDRKHLLIALMAMFTLGNLASALAPDYHLLIAARLATALPHGTFFGVGSVLAAALVPPTKRAQAVSLMIAGLTLANVVGVPVGTLAAHHLGWRAAFALVTAVGAATLIALVLLVPHQRPRPGSSIRREFAALTRAQTWLALAVGALGFGGFFASYSYISPLLTRVTGLATDAVPLVLALCGIGMTCGNLIGGRAADRHLMPTMYTAMAAMTLVLLAQWLLAPHPIAAVALVFLLGLSSSALVPCLQTRLMDTAADAPSLAAALNHSALNFANAAGAWLGGIVIAAGHGLAAPNLLGAGLGIVGLALITASVIRDRTAPPAPTPAADAPTRTT
ncbi:MFS transporter [Streptomonospora litoralis]|uniref:Inner membrane transport protein YdhP n=1 Tax=Streptomonospora litoralis TaxID=2498135 RepID=A0A4P6Q1A0_9ACTN|nr:MFS transporter [Streptomonospora litoralis]QBI54406.1 Inner membrane transport protein YdhP [Streptomonospora litoralis]